MLLCFPHTYWYCFNWCSTFAFRRHELLGLWFVDRHYYIDFKRAGLIETAKIASNFS